MKRTMVIIIIAVVLAYLVYLNYEFLLDRLIGLINALIR